ncbi:flippase-like domain-containing protein [Fulvivirga sp. RKSG066]|uniref:lysylphosphatidylglycerol synthase transmembrane domain-containing protein n=1 Tax=Fulvivirga aurantia TaxID=2529383 RepID=UPI0012BC39CF|nr:lysylphosphatidylglycerol synthase transmembrane domain-containing protein [Fulvivirga aurantia]MTI20236.1 flippase-like domain-containing protein [Fulvivirga aurantia]
MRAKLKAGLKYAVMLTVTAFLLWLSFNNIQVTGDESKMDFIVRVWNEANIPFLFLSALAAVLSHVIRAERWKLLLSPLGHKTKLSHGFMSVMVGYFINLAIPRGGEVSRCYNLYRLNKTPVDVSLGTVVAERVIDLIFLIVLLGTSFLVEVDNLMYFFQSDEIQKLRGEGQDSGFPYMLISGVIIFIIAVYFIIRYILAKKRFFALRFISKGKKVLAGIKNGVTAVFKLEKRFLFIVYSLLIWICYYLMMYLVMMAFPETAELGFLAALTIFVIGGIAMAVPLPGGAGSFHILVPLGLVILYGLSQDKAVAFTFIFHGWQTLVIIIVGALSLVLSQTKNKSKSIDQRKNNIN